MRCAIVLGLAFFGVLGACGDDSSQDDKNRPATFWDTCEVADDCATPFECLAVEGAKVRLCTKKCDETSDCPRWEATGHCAGDFQSQCLNGTCIYGCS
jgi:hypothetical protein